MLKVVAALIRKDNKILIAKRSTGNKNVIGKWEFPGGKVEENLDIKLLKNDGKYSKMNGFIGGCMARVKNKIIILGDISKIDKEKKIRNFIQSRNLEIVYFNGLDVIDYGGVLVI